MILSSSERTNNRCSSKDATCKRNAVASLVAGRHACARAVGYAPRRRGEAARSCSSMITSGRGTCIYKHNPMLVAF
eukprot:6200860-Pleurochrysis_carterae.AAC.1